MEPMETTGAHGHTRLNLSTSFGGGGAVGHSQSMQDKLNIVTRVSKLLCFDSFPGRRRRIHLSPEQSSLPYGWMWLAYGQHGSYKQTKRDQRVAKVGPHTVITIMKDQIRSWITPFCFAFLSVGFGSGFAGTLCPTILGSTGVFLFLSPLLYLSQSVLFLAPFRSAPRSTPPCPPVTST